MTPASLLILQNGQQVGPFPSEAVREMLMAGSLSPQDYAWSEGMPEWVTLESLFPATAPAPRAQSSGGAAYPGSSGERTFGSFVGDAFSYPFRGNGVFILVTGMIVFSALDWLTGLPGAGLYGILLSAALWGYLLLMLQSIIHGTAQGEETLPRWPTFDGRGELFGKTFQWFVTIGFCFGPALLALFFARGADGEPNGVLVGVLALAGAIYLPMAMLGVAMYDSLAALNPLLIFRAIFAVPGHYILTLIVFAGLAVVNYFTGAMSGSIPYAGVLIDKLDELWAAVFLSRVLGGLYYVNRRKLGWF